MGFKDRAKDSIDISVTGGLDWLKGNKKTKPIGNHLQRQYDKYKVLEDKEKKKNKKGFFG